MTKKTLKDFLEVYKPKSPDEQKFVDKHVTIKHKDRNGNDDDVFNAANIKTIKRKEERHGYDVGEDEKVYEEVEQVEERWSENSKKTSKNLAAAALDVGNAATGGLLSKSKLARKAMKWADSPDETTSKSRLKAYQARQARNTNEEVEDVEEARIYPGDYHVTSEKSPFGGHRPKVVHKDKGHTMYLSQHSYKKPAMAIRHGEAYLTAYAARGDRAADNASIDFARANKKHLYVKEEVEIIEGLMHDRYERSHGKKARGTGSWAFTTQRYGSPKQSEMHFTSGQKSLSDAHKEAAAKLGTKHLYVMEDIDIDTVLDEALNMLMSIDEKTLTPAEMKKREEVVKAIKRENPKMDKSMAYAVATKTAKRVAEGVVPSADEPSEHDKKMAQKVRDLLAKEKKPVKEEAEELDELSYDTMVNYRKKAQKAIRNSDTDDKTVNKREIGWDMAGKRMTAKLRKEEAEDLDESVAKVANHLIKRYGENVRKSHVRSAANDFGVGFVALSHHVRKKLGVNRLEEEQIDELSTKTLRSYRAKARDDAFDADAVDDERRLRKRSAGHNTAGKKIIKRGDTLRAEEVEQIDEISAKKLTDYTAKASDARGHRNMSAAKLDKRYAGMALAHEKIRARHAKVPANEEVEELDELSKKTLGSYTYKAASELGSKGITTGLKIAADEPTEKNFKKMANRQKGVATAVKKLTKEDIINRSIDKYVPEEAKFTPEERLLKRLEGLSEAHTKTLLGLFEALNKDNQNRMIETVETREGINQLLNFALDNRGE